MSILQKLYIPKSTTEFSAKSRFVLFAVLTVIVSAVFVLSLVVGSSKVDIISVLLGLCEKSSPDYRIVYYVRLPRALGAVLCGSALAVAGAITQAVLNNPMAAPNIIGVNSGAGLGAILCMALAPSMVFAMPLAAFSGALGACILIYTIAQKTGASRITITLVGIAVSSVLTSCINIVKTLFPDSVYNMTTFSVGGLGGADFAIIKYAAPMIVICLILAFLLSKDMDVMCLGEDTAASLGMNVKRLRLVLMVCASILAGCAVSIAGLIGFVGLVVPHIARRFTESYHALLIPACALCGALFMLVCDIFSRVLFAPYEVPVGILMSLIGGFFFIGLILTKRRKHNA